MEEALIVGIVFFSLVAIAKIIADSVNRRRFLERAAMDNSEMPKGFQIHPELINLSSLKWGMVLVGIGLAWLISNWLPYQYRDESIIGLMFLLAGIGMLIYYPIAQRKIKMIEKGERSHTPTT